MKTVTFTKVPGPYTNLNSACECAFSIKDFRESHMH